MTTHQVTLNGQAVAVGREHFKLLTMVRSFEHHDGDGNKVTRHDLVMEGVDTSGKEVTKFTPAVPLKNGDVIEILIGESHEAEQSRQPMPVNSHDCIRTPSARHGCAFRSA